MFQRTRQGAVDVISGEGPLTGDHVDSLLQVLDQCLAHGQPRAVLDLHQVPLLDSLALEGLLDAQRRFVERAGTLKLANPNPLCRDIFAVTGVEASFEIYRDVSSAVGSFV